MAAETGEQSSRDVVTTQMIIAASQSQYTRQFGLRWRLCC